MKKSIFAIMLALLMALTACGGGDKPEKEEDKTPDANQEEVQKPEDDEKEENKPEEDAPTLYTEEDKPEVKEYKTSDGKVYCTSSVSYPVMGGTDVRRDSINAYFDEVREDKREDIDEIILPYASNGSVTGNPLAFDVTWKSVRNDEKFVSFETEEYVNLGGAYPTIYIRMYNFDKNGNEASFENLFRGDDDQWEHKLFTAAADKLKEQGLAGYNGEFTAEELEDQFDDDDFLVREDGITVIWQDGVLAPHAAGILRADIAFDEIADILTEGVR